MFHDEEDHQNYSSVQDRIPTVYHLHVINQTGALIREGPEIEASRVIMLAPSGTLITAYERQFIEGRIIRYRTDYGWLSECRRDQRREPIVELLDVDVGSAKDDAVVTKKDIAMMTMRESVSYAMERSFTSLKHLAINLGKLSSLQYYYLFKMTFEK
jgi:predicted ATPase